MLTNEVGPPSSTPAHDPTIVAKTWSGCRSRRHHRTLAAARPGLRALGEGEAGQIDVLVGRRLGTRGGADEQSSDDSGAPGSATAEPKGLPNRPRWRGGSGLTAGASVDGA
jgi:hypothetical protein